MSSLPFVPSSRCNSQFIESCRRHITFSPFKIPAKIDIVRYSRKNCADEYCESFSKENCH